MKRIIGLNSLSNEKNQDFSSNNNYIIGRVKYCILDSKTYPDLYKKYGELDSIGGVVVEFLDNLKINTTDNYIFAKPFFPNYKNFPIKNELVNIMVLPTFNSQTNVDSISYYYFGIVNIWNNIHHNTLPNQLYKLENSRDDLGIKNLKVNFGETFNERYNINSLQPFEGDIILEGRWGQSIRFGSTIKNSKILNSWSSTGDNGDPIILIVNGHKIPKEELVLFLENINDDLSSLYLTSTQKIPIKVSSPNYKSYITTPIKPDQYNLPQIIFNSGRILFNSTRDSILFSSKKTIGLSAIESINLDSPKTIISSDEVLLGGNKAKESIVLGDTFLTDFEKLLNQLVLLGTSLQTPIGTPVPFTPNTSIVSPAVQVTETAKDMLKSINKYKSKISKTL